jgi:hypothetical protein
VFIQGELGGGEGYGHREHRWVRDVERRHPFFSHSSLGASENGAEFGLVHLHSLLYHSRAVSVMAHRGGKSTHRQRGSQVHRWLL